MKIDAKDLHFRTLNEKVRESGDREITVSYTHLAGTGHTDHLLYWAYAQIIEPRTQKVK